MEQLDFLKKVHDSLIVHASKLRFDKKDAVQLYLIALHCSLIELSNCMITLLKTNGNIGVPAIVRAFLESYVEFCNLHKNPEYGYRMEFNDVLQGKKFLDKIPDTAVDVHPDLCDLKRMYADEHNNLKESGVESISIRERFRCAGMEDLYNSYYIRLCVDVHANVTALVDRHVKINNDDFEVSLYKNTSVEYYRIEIALVTEKLIDATMNIHTYFNAEACSNIRILQEESVELYKDYWS